MFPSVSSPPGFVNPVEARLSAALAAAGAWDATPIEIACAGAQWVTFQFFYTRAGAGGDFQFRIESSLRSADDLVLPNWARASVMSVGGVVSGADTLSNIQRGDIEYGSTGAGVEGFTYGPLHLGGTIERIRVPAHESGAIATPGTLYILAVFVY